MQHMSPGEIPEQQRIYGAYEGNATNSGGQKLNVDEDEQFADILARRIKQELKDEMRGSPKDETVGYRLALAIVSICIVVPLFIALVVALALGLGTGGSGPALVWSFIAACGVIIVVNGYFNRSSTTQRK